MCSIHRTLPAGDERPHRKSFRREILMIIKKLAAAFLAAAALLTTGSAVFAETTATATATKNDAATFAFDTNKSLSYVHSFGNASDTNLTLNISDTGALAGRCLEMRESFTNDVTNQYGGFYIDAADLGLETFGGYTVTVGVKVNKKVAKKADSLVLFSDGEQWVTSGISTAFPDSYLKCTLTVPAGIQNTKIGISLPITSSYDDWVCYVDDIVITDNYGNKMPNIGDVDTSLAEKPNAGLSALSIGLFIVLAVIVIGGIAYFIINTRRRFR